MTGDMQGFISEIVDWVDGRPVVRVRHIPTRTVVAVGSTPSELLNRSYGIAYICRHLRMRGWLAGTP